MPTPPAHRPTKRRPAPVIEQGRGYDLDGSRDVLRQLDLTGRQVRALGGAY
ncbi:MULTISPECIES: hypothetical protein [unclassified Caulobacter]|uniref:hypothetical protein n=1 Tax=unclassified Caulobacter TaxID=2648921 RepID=UPI001304E2F8|nr:MULTISPECIES: hypothetical protein [unclassified Caulobacter]